MKVIYTQDEFIPLIQTIKTSRPNKARFLDMGKIYYCHLITKSCGQLVLKGFENCHNECSKVCGYRPKRCGRPRKNYG